MKLRRRARGHVDFGGDNCDTLGTSFAEHLNESVVALVVSIY